MDVLGPHPWVTWATALGPLAVQTWRSSPGAGVALVAGVQLSLVAVEAVLAVLVAGGRHRLSGTGYRRAPCASAVLPALAGRSRGRVRPQALGR